jgi:hypothetical protein
MAVASEVIEQLGDIRTNRILTSKKADVFVHARGG